jgi:hypothetical protein
MKKAQFRKEAERYIGASQKVKAATQALKELRERVIDGFEEHVKPDERGCRTAEFDGDLKITLAPRRVVNEKALKKALGPQLPRFMDFDFTVSLSAIQAKHGEELALKVKEALHGAVSKVLGGKAPNGAVAVTKTLNKKAALASLDKATQRRVKVQDGETLRPYPPQEGFKGLLKAALSWLKS